MRIELDETALELEAEPGSLRASVDKDGFDGSCLDVICRYVDAQETDTGLRVAYALADGETIVNVTPMIWSSVGRIDAERLLGIDRLQNALNFRDRVERPACPRSRGRGILRAQHRREAIE